MKFLENLAGRFVAESHVDTALAGVGSKTTYTGMTSTAVGWLTSSQAVTIIGLTLGICGFALNWYYSRKRDRREQELHELRMTELREEIARAK